MDPRRSYTLPYEGSKEVQMKTKVLVHFGWFRPTVHENQQSRAANTHSSPQGSSGASFVKIREKLPKFLPNISWDFEIGLPFKISPFWANFQALDKPKIGSQNPIDIRYVLGPHNISFDPIDRVPQKANSRPLCKKSQPILTTVYVKGWKVSLNKWHFN